MPETHLFDLAQLLVGTDPRKAQKKYGALETSFLRFASLCDEGVGGVRVCHVIPRRCPLIHLHPVRRVLQHGVIRAPPSELVVFFGDIVCVRFRLFSFGSALEIGTGVIVVIFAVVVVALVLKSGTIFCLDLLAAAARQKGLM